ncbi:formin-binding protein 4-like isoform X2 [Centruroides vittatus]|uniref:formin-binding protein 4-like isoform X2 n=1 Tax=Centruroides vittatus TaxID=120091 RepID=UPI00350F6EA5
MGKRRDKTVRRQKLQLNDEKLPVSTVRNPLQKIMQYSDSEEEGNKINNNEMSSTNESKQDSSRHIDLEVADFLKEIDELNPNSEETNDDDKFHPVVEDIKSSNVKQIEQHSSDSQSTIKQERENAENSIQNQDSHEVCSTENFKSNNDTRRHTSWQHCYDEHSGYIYFWNMDTNEVTWECPEEYSSYFRTIDKTALTNNKETKEIGPMGKQRKKRELEMKTRSEIPYDGKITPITYFEPHVSSDDSSEDEKIETKLPRKKLKSSQSSSSQSNVKNIKDTEPKVQGCAPEKNNSNTKKSTLQDNDSLIGPQLPSYYKPRDSKLEEGIESNSKETVNSFSHNKDSTNEIQVSLSSDKENDKNDRFPSSCIKSNQFYGQEPDSTTRKESTSESKRKEGYHNGIKTMTKKVLKTLVQYAESGSEDEKEENQTVYNSETYRQDGRQGFGFKECSSTNKNQSKSEKDIEKDYPMISFIKSNEVLDLNKLNQQKTENMKIHQQFAEVPSITSNNKLNTLETSETSSRQKINENFESGKLSRNQNILSNTEISNKPENLKQIQELSNLMLDKLSFLTSGQAELSSLYQLLLQLQTRFTDWKENALSSSYFLNKLQDVQDFLRQYEMNAMPSGWICDWDRQHKRYFYVNERTGRTQWDYPQTVGDQMHSEAISESSISNGLNVAERKNTQLPQHSLVSSSVSEATAPQIASVPSVYTSNTGYQAETTWSSRVASHETESPPPSPPGVDKPLQPPLPPLPPLPPPNSPPPPPPDSTELEDGEIADVEMEIDSDDQCDEQSISTSLQIPNELKNDSQLSYQSSPSSSISVIPTSVTDNAVIIKPPNSSISSNEDKMINHYLITSVNYPHSSVCQSTFECASNKIHDSISVNSTEVSNTSVLPPKKERKKMKNIPSLVQKWQKIKEQQEKDSGNSGIPI